LLQFVEFNMHILFYTDIQIRNPQFFLLYHQFQNSPTKVGKLGKFYCMSV